LIFLTIIPNILVVDDVFENLMLIESILSTFNINIILAQNAQQALSKIEGVELALALIDVRMLGINGIELAEIIQNDKKRQLVPIIFISGMAMEELELERCYRSGGAVDFIRKPFKSYVLRGKVKVFLELYNQKLAILDSEKMYRTLLNASPEGIIIMDLNGNITQISDITLEIFGAQNKDQFINSKFFGLFLPEDEDNIKNLLLTAKSEGLVHNVEYILLHKNQSKIICEISVTLIQEASRQPKAYMANIREISYRKKMEQQLIRSERMISLGEMSSAMAHEINQPLLSMNLSLENLIHKIKTKCPDEIDYIHNKSEKIFGDIVRISRIIDHVRAFSSDHKKPIFSAFDVTESINNAVSMISEQFKYHLIHLTLKMDVTLHSVCGDIFRFEQVILNLLNNAKDALEEKMKLAPVDYTKEIIISSSLKCSSDQAVPPTIIVKVSDNGAGIDKADLDLIMLPFYTTKEVGKGTGLGLSVSYGVIKEMNGNIDIESEYMQGTTFTITVPAFKN
jgi:PAS domain S-box-containing protein